MKLLHCFFRPFQCALLLSSLLICPNKAFSPIKPRLSLTKIASASSMTRQYTHRSVLSINHIDSESSMSSDSDRNEEEAKPECASLLPGQVITIRIGDTSLARKAWKKRRRSGSPILVPCTIVGMNRELMVKNNLINLIHRFGKTSKEHPGVIISVGAIVKLYKYRLGGDLLQHAKALGHDTIVSYLRSIFDNNSTKDNGISLVRIGSRNELALASPLSIRLARESAFKAEFVQFVCDDNGDNRRMVHSGTTFQIATEKEKYQTIATLDTSTVQPLSAAVRISHADEVGSRITNGMECNAFVHSYESEGDNGSPLLICSIDPPREQIRDQVKRRAYISRKISKSNNDIKMIKSFDGESMRDLKSLKSGDGPFQATVVRVSERAGAAFVDLGVSRQKGKKHGGGKARVLGMLRFEDGAVQEDDSEFEELKSSECTGEEAALIEASILEGFNDDDDDHDEQTFEEDVSNMYSVDEDGNISFIDPVTLKSTTIGSIDDDSIEVEYGDDNDDDKDDDDDIFVGMSPEERLSAIGDLLAESEKQETKADSPNIIQKSLQVGDEVEVYIQGVFPQSGRFMVTTKNQVKKMKDVKQERMADKRLERLASKLGGDDGLELIKNSIGKEMEGEIKAISKAGDWYYVHPISEEGLPVGLGPCLCTLDEPLKAGDKVLICIDGIDYQRGQMSLKIINKL